MVKYNASEEKDNYYIQDSWLSAEIRNIHFVKPNQQETTPKKPIELRCLGGCLKIIGFFFFLMIITQVKVCSRKTIKEKNAASYNFTKEEIYNQEENLTVNEAEAKLRKAILEINVECPKQLKNGITCERIDLTLGTFSYCYMLDDALFDKVISAANKEMQLSQLKAQYEQMKPMIALLIKTNRGLNYVYTNKSKTKTHTEFLSVEDLKNLARNST